MRTYQPQPQTGARPITPMPVHIKEADRRRIADDVRRFLAQGGDVDEVDHTANRGAPAMAYNNESAKKMQQRNRTRAANARDKRQRTDLKFGAQSCNRKNAS